MLEQDKYKIEQNIFSENAQIATDALLDITFNSDDWEWVQNICIALINNSKNEDLRGLAVTCIGHLARIHGVTNKTKVLPILRSLTNNSILAGRIEDALDDIEQFT